MLDGAGKCYLRWQALKGKVGIMEFVVKRVNVIAGDVYRCTLKVEGKRAMAKYQLDSSTGLFERIVAPLELQMRCEELMLIRMLRQWSAGRSVVFPYDLVFAVDTEAEIAYEPRVQIDPSTIPDGIVESVERSDVGWRRANLRVGGEAIECFYVWVEGYALQMMMIPKFLRYWFDNDLVALFCRLESESVTFPVVIKPHMRANGVRRD